ncbi:GH92 family glycosyl hydrolase [Pararcticibacter amylolyticus]|uniref:Glycoside hydrolase family 92 protein n=1 Tax=Pararcticibacter amylolyticus TaxID=2173175 RepID=A0A2U2PA41_9SPHI|nr:GH92 family glycosyl hydrolase [Pararcticibacter amylolyticus]PWG78243.1 glycoside hydrolase family 92 protein [Pararcticibacter amylolyticus]
MLKKLTHLTIFLSAISAGLQAQPADKLTSFVNPFIGTGAVDASSLSGSNFPGATVPFGFVQLSPDTQDNPDNPASGYDHNDKTIVGFSHTHLSGTGVADLFDVLFMPATGEVKTVPGEADKPGSGYRSRFSHNEESARPGYYQVKLSDYNVNAELTATEHTGFHRYTFPAGAKSQVIIDMNHSLNKKRSYWSCRIIGAELRVIDNKTIEGYRILTGWAKMRKIYFRAEFSRPFSSHKMINGQRVYENEVFVNGTNIKSVLNFGENNKEPLLVKVGLSPVSLENAKMNMDQEISGWDFEKVVSEAENKWEQELEKIHIEGTKEQKQIFYTGLYHAFTQPNNMADVNGEYQASDFTIRKADDKKHYSTFSLWDTYRAAHPLYTLIQQERTADFINSMFRQYDTYGYLPIWQLWGDENYCMIGNHAIPVIVDAALKGLKGFDIGKAYEAVKGSSVRTHPGSPFDLWNKYHFMPENQQSQSVSITLEMAYDDWCVAQLAKKLNKTDDYTYFMARSMYYKNLYDSQTGFFRAKNDDGKWVSPFNPLQYGGNGGNPYTEGNAWQYFWYVPQDVKGLISLVGGDKAFITKLDQFFTLKDLPGEVNGNASGFIGQYAHGNEPSHHAAYLYNYAGQPWKTQAYVAQVLNELYNNSFSGYSGNEDCGQMSSWYIFSAMGFYPVNPANSIYAIGSPVLPKAVIHLPGKDFTVTTKNPSKKNLYIQSVKLNGKSYNKTYITHQDIVKGGTLEFTMGPQPNKKWGVSADARPLDSAFK